MFLGLLLKETHSKHSNQAQGVQGLKVLVPIKTLLAHPAIETLPTPIIVLLL